MGYMKRFPKLKPDDIEVIQEIRALSNEGWKITEVVLVSEKRLLREDKIKSTLVFYELYNKEWIF